MAILCNLGIFLGKLLRSLRVCVWVVIRNVFAICYFIASIKIHPMMYHGLDLTKNLFSDFSFTLLYCDEDATIIIKF